MKAAKEELLLAKQQAGENTNEEDGLDEYEDEFNMYKV